jgi:hypothetical protein
MMRNHVAITVAAVLAMALTPGDARAQAKPATRVITLTEFTIVGHVQKPIASVDVNKIQPKLTLAELSKPFLYRIEEATTKDPF